MPEHYDDAATEDVAAALPFGQTEEDQITPVEMEAVKKAMKEHEMARAFDAPARKQFAIDRAYAAGKADQTWASDANLIGSFIDVLVAFLYARDPDMDTRPAEQVDSQPTRDQHAFADTLALVVPRLWKDGKLKKTARKAVRSALSVGPGWFKALMLTKTGRDPQIEKDLNDAQDNLRRIERLMKEMDEGSTDSPDTLELRQQQLNEAIEGLNAQVEVIMRAGMAIDFVRADDIQVSLDVAELSDYLDADWIDHSIYVPQDDLKNRFERLTDNDVRAACVYYMRQPHTDKSTGSETPEFGEATHEKGQFTKLAPPNAEGQDVVKFARVIERWDKRDNLIRTMIDGTKRWAREPYPPPFATTRFYPFFYLSLFEVDGERFPQSLSWRLRKLQEEYATARSNFRRARERSVPGTVFNASQVDPKDARKLETSVAMEYIGIKPTDPNADMRGIFAEKPVPRLNHNLYDTQPILSDMERISGVQEALQSTVQTAKTATEAEIQQSGFASRTSASRDALEEVMRELALYSVELALQAVPADQVQRIAGPLSFWPEGMDIEDILTLVEVDIDAGSTGKPNNHAERETWSIVMPIVLQLIKEIHMVQAVDPHLAEALANFLRETLKRLDDRLDVEKLIPMPGGGMMLPPGGGPGGPGLPPPEPDLPPEGAAPPPVEPPAI
jgi:hypothetical protein